MFHNANIKQQNFNFSKFYNKYESNNYIWKLGQYFQNQTKKKTTFDTSSTASLFVIVAEDVTRTTAKCNIDFVQTIFTIA
jgi:hypothetical protein